jgi:hypothetical protein
MAGRPAEELSKIEAQIARKVNGSLIYLLLSGFGVGYFIFCPLVYFRCRQALRLIEEYSVGEKYRGNATLFSVIAAIIFVAYTLGIVAILLLIPSLG